MWPVKDAAAGILPLLTATSLPPSSLPTLTMLEERELVRLAETTSPPSMFNTEAIYKEKYENINALNASERRWRHYRSWLRVRAGYDLRPRYHPGWQPPPKNMYGAREDCREQLVRSRIYVSER